MPEQNPQQKLESIRTAVNPLAARAFELHVDSAETHAEAEGLIQSLGNGIRVVVAFFEPSRTATKAAARAVREQEAEVLDPLKDSREVLTTRCSNHEKRARAAAEVETLRREQAAAEDRRALAEQEAADAAIDGDTVAADRILEEERVSPPPAVPFVAPDIDDPRPGLSTTIHWFANLVSFPELIQWVAEDTTNRAFYLSARMPALNQWAKLPEAVRPPIPGVEADYKSSKRSTR